MATTSTATATASVASVPGDRILPITRVGSVIVVPILVLAFIILYFYPDQSGERFAWHLQPHMQAMYVGAGYIGGAWIFLRTLFERRWHRVAAGFLPVSMFTVSMLLLTIVHWGFFDVRHFPFQLWLILYIVTPVLVPWLWWNNRREDPGTPEEADAVVPQPVRWLMSAVGAVLLAGSVAAFIFPALLIQTWPWTLATLGARAMAGWHSLMGVGGLVLGRERRWSAWRIPLESIAIWHILVVVAAILNPADFAGGLLNWYIVGIVLIGMAVAALYLWMESRRRLASQRGAVSTRAL